MDGRHVMRKWASLCASTLFSLVGAAHARPASPKAPIARVRGHAA
jgi:hypothetical protein